MTAWHVYWTLRRRRIELEVLDGKIRAPRGALGEQDRDAIHRLKEELVQLVTAAAVADRYVEAVRGGADLPPLTKVSRAEAERRLVEWEANSGEKTRGMPGGSWR